MHFITEYAFGVHGYVVRWELYSGSARRVQLQAWRCMGEYQYELVGEISAQIAKGYNVVNVDSDSHMLVQPEDVVVGALLQRCAHRAVANLEART